MRDLLFDATVRLIDAEAAGKMKMAYSLAGSCHLHEADE